MNLVPALIADSGCDQRRCGGFVVAQWDVSWGMGKGEVGRVKKGEGSGGT